VIFLNLDLGYFHRAILIREKNLVRKFTSYTAALEFFIKIISTQSFGPFIPTLFHSRADYNTMAQLNNHTYLLPQNEPRFELDHTPNPISPDEPKNQQAPTFVTCINMYSWTILVPILIL